LREVDEEVLVARVYAMLGKVLGNRVVAKVVERCNDGAVEDFGEGELARGIKRGIHADSNEGCKESGQSNEDEGEWPVDVLVMLESVTIS
jgi:hypothetical protein